MEMNMFDQQRIARRCVYALSGVLGLTLALPLLAQVGPDDPDWKESNAPTPPTFSADKLLPLNMPRYVTLNVGIDPTTLTITPDGIVRYVVVTRNASGSVNAMFEGIRCATSEVKTYAHASGTGVWSMVAEPKWRDFTDNLPSNHAWVFARQAACDGRSTAGSSTAGIIKALKK
jgi:hypothetical protein